jgi:outer membrane protein assembly factor BamA
MHKETSMRNRFRSRLDPRASRFVAGVLLSVCASVSPAGAQEPANTAAAQEIAIKPVPVSALTPIPNRMMRTFTWIESKVDNSSGGRDGFYPEIGGMIYGAGISVGPGYRQHLFGERAVIDVSGAISSRRYEMMQARITWPRLMNDHLALGAQVKYQDATEINFFGIGTDSLRTDQTDFRLKNMDTLGFATVRANSWLSVTGRTGVLRRVDIDRGRSTLHPSIEERFDDSTAPGLTEQPDYLHADLAVEADTRDVPGYPARGGRYRMSFAAFHDQSFSRYSFRRIEADAAHWIPLGRSVLALRGRMDVSQDGGHEIPFYLLPTLGGANSLRGYRDYRFRDRDSLLVTAEYRWPIVHMLDAAVFYDAGTVAATMSRLTRHLKSDYGAGVRVHTARHMLFRVDVARSNEGTRAIFGISAPLGSSRSVVPYVP